MSTTRGLYDKHSLIHPGPCSPPGAGTPGVPLSEEASHFFAPRCVLCCRVLPVSPLVSEVEVSGRISAPIARRLSADNAGRAPRGRDGGLLAVSTLAWEVEVEVEVFDRISASIEGRLYADRALVERLGDEGPLWRRCDDWGLWWLGGSALACESAGLFML